MTSSEYLAIELARIILGAVIAVGLVGLTALAAIFWRQRGGR